MISAQRLSSRRRKSATTMLRAYAQARMHVILKYETSAVRWYGGWRKWRAHVNSVTCEKVVACCCRRNAAEIILDRKNEGDATHYVRVCGSARSYSSNADSRAASPIYSKLEQERSQTRVLNDVLLSALRGKASVMGSLRALESSRARYDSYTLGFCVRLLRQVPPDEMDSRQRLLFAVRALRRARLHGVRPNSHVLSHLMPLAKPLRKVNIVLAAFNLVPRRDALVLPLITSKALISFYSMCGRPDLMVHAFYDSLRIHGAEVDADAFTRVLLGFLAVHDALSARQVWQVLRAPPFCSVVQPDVALLNCGAWVCSSGSELPIADEARWILDQFSVLQTLPSPRVANLLLSSFVHAGEFEAAREHMRLIYETFGYRLQERHVQHYIPECVRRGADDELLPLAHELARAMRLQLLGSDEREAMRLLRAYLKHLYCAVSEQPQRLDATHAAEAALAVFLYDDSISASYVVYLAAAGGRLDDALRIANWCHTQYAPNMGMMHAFAYDALAEQCAHSARVVDLLHMLFGSSTQPTCGGSGDESARIEIHPHEPHPTSMTSLDGEQQHDRAVPSGESELGKQEAPSTALSGAMVKVPDTASHALDAKAGAAAKLVETFSRLGRLDLCDEVYSRCVEQDALSMEVSTAYMYALGMAQPPRAEEAIAQFHALQTKHGGSLDVVVFSALGSVVTNAVAQGAMNVSLAAEILSQMELHLCSMPDMRAHYEKLLDQMADAPVGAPWRASLERELKDAEYKIEGFTKLDQKVAQLRALLSHQADPHSVDDVSMLPNTITTSKPSETDTETT
ncbi:hypothetical protein FVE85_0027 [Porphyridium purpureum]|uniref:Uncharacterized protein n=1 Tax=Porphyridium purpureum TaxID=35688 RepID=A0A5J4YYV3_PORPP|nr:hypothetical protein FVE85_0027 [Porphyridium purpureum]|eukprot:POR9786..scf208_2